MRFLKMLYADTIRHVIVLSKRYWVSRVTDVIAFYIIFIGIYFALSSITGFNSAEKTKIIAGQIAGYMAFYFASMILAVIDQLLYEEIRQGTLEQLMISPHSLLSIISSHLLASLELDILTAVPLFFLLTLTTGIQIYFNWQMVVVFALILCGVYGLALIIGGLTLIFKRTGQLAYIFQILFLGLGFSSVSNLPKIVQSVSELLPFTRGVMLLKDYAMGNGQGLIFRSPDFLYLLVNTFIYISVGILFFDICTSFVKGRGTFAQY